ncbi:MAG TPA: S53 family peptidase [Solirubrobacteraceae bacterium]|nr:S53 family peptidase [Solirubrobacteraceae bacterium]
MSDQVPLPGSERPAKRGAQRVRDLDPEQRIDATITLAGPPLPMPGVGEPLSREQLEREHGSEPDVIARVTAALAPFGLLVSDSSPLTRSLHVNGTAAQFEAAFKPGLGIYSHPDLGEFRGREGQLQIPAELEGLVTGVFGLDERRMARRRCPTGGLVQAQAAVGSALPPAGLAAHYSFPAGDGAGQAVAIAEFGGGYFASDLEAFCAKQGTAVPTVTPVGVNGTPVLTLAQIQQLPQQQRQQQLDDSVEVNMDVQIVAGLAPGAEQIVYFSSFDEQGWVDLINEVIAGRPAPAVTLSISWGLAEDDPSWSTAARTAIDERLQAAAAIGITVCVAAGDDGSADQESDGRAHIDFPAASPHVLAVGGTMLTGQTDVVWWEAPGERTNNGGGATGGGVSVVFPRPSWQDVQIASRNPGAIDGRVIPDVAALAGPPFYDLIFTGQDQPNGGTSAATPLWAALIALLAASPDRPWKPQFLAPLLYAASSDGTTAGSAGCTDVTSGDNTSSTLGSGYSAEPGFDAVSGWGVPNGTALLQALPRRA